MIRVTIRKDVLILSIVFMIFLPITLTFIPGYNAVATSLRILIGCFLIFSYAFKLKRSDIYAWIWILYCFSFLNSYFVSGEFIIKDFIIMIYPVGFFLMVYIETLKDLKKMIDVFYFVSILICMLFVFEFLCSFFLGRMDTPLLTDNRNGVQTYMSFVIGSVYMKKDYKKCRLKSLDFLLLLISCLGVFLSGSATGFLSVLVGLILMRLSKIPSAKTEWIAFVLLFVVLSVLQNTDIGLLQYIFSFFNKSTTFSNRLWRWKFSLEQIKENLLFGTHDVEHRASLFASYDVEFFNPHSAYMYILLFGGLLATFLITILIINLSKIDEKYFSVFMGIVFVTALMESNMSPSSFVFSSFVAITSAWLKLKRKQAIISGGNNERCSMRYDDSFNKLKNRNNCSP